jgi:MFS family permease
MTTSPLRQLAVTACVQVLAMATWFSASAVIPQLRVQWHVSSGSASWLTIAVQVGFVAGALCSAIFNIADVVNPRRLVGCSALAAAAATAAFAMFAHGLTVALPLRFITGFALAGVYPTCLKVVATWFVRGRGLALGVVVASLTFGGAVPQLINSLGHLPWKDVVYFSAAMALVSAALATMSLRPGPLSTDSPPLQLGYVLTLFRNRQSRLANIGYFGHMWELYAMWTWLPALITASNEHTSQHLPVAFTAFLAVGVCGAVGCALAGLLGDRYGRANLASLAMTVSATSCLLAALAFGTNAAVFAVVVAVWGISIIADSGLFSTCMSQVVEPQYVGTALTAQTAIGFMITVVTIRVTPFLVSHSSWRVALLVLAVGPIVGAIAMRRLTTCMTHRRESPSPISTTAQR